MNPAIKDLFTTIEIGFNITGTVPVVSFFSGMIRAIAGKVQMIVGAILATFSYINFLISNDQKWTRLSTISCEFFIHGALNVIRGLAEAALCATTIVGNIGLLIPNMAKEEMFGPYFTYGAMSDRQFEVKCIVVE